MFLKTDLKTNSYDTKYISPSGACRAITRPEKYSKFHRDIRHKLPIQYKILYFVIYIDDTSLNPFFRFRRPTALPLEIDVNSVPSIAICFISTSGNDDILTSLPARSVLPECSALLPCLSKLPPELNIILSHCLFRSCIPVSMLLGVGNCISESYDVQLSDFG